MIHNWFVIKNCINDRILILILYFDAKYLNGYYNL